MKAAAERGLIESHTTFVTDCLTHLSEEGILNCSLEKVLGMFDFETVSLTPPSLNNETIGVSAEKAICDLFNIPCGIEPRRLSNVIVQKISDSGILEILKINNILPNKHIGDANGPIDFEVNKSETLSLKTLKKKDGKICPQGGQPTYNSFDKKWGLTEQTKYLERIEANKVRCKFVQNNAGTFLNQMQSDTFCCNYLLLLTNCKKTPKAELLKNKNFDFTKFDSIDFSRENYEERPHSRKPGPAEFYSLVTGTINGKEKKIGEFQIHFKSRKNIKFRFFNTLFN